MHTYRAKRSVDVRIFHFYCLPPRGCCSDRVLPCHPLSALCTVCQSRCAMQGPSPPTRSWAIRPPTNANQRRAHENGIFSCIRLGYMCLRQPANRRKFRRDKRGEVFSAKFIEESNKRLFLPRTNAAKLLLRSHLSTVYDFNVVFLYMILVEGRGSGQWKRGTPPWATTLPWWKGFACPNDPRSSVVGELHTPGRATHGKQAVGEGPDH